MAKLKQKKLKIRGEEYVVREMKGTERYRCHDINQKEGTTGMVGWLLKRCTIKPESINIDEEPSEVIEKLFLAIQRLSGMDEDADADALKK